MSGFFEYFKALGMPYIRKPGGVNEGLVRTAAALMDDSKEDMKWLRYQFFPELCEDEHVDDHAEARGIERYQYESDEFFRNRVAGAFRFFANGGTKSGVNAFLESLGLDAHILEYHDGYYGEPEIGWAEFAAVINMESLDQTVENRQFLAVFLNELKPARSKLALLIFTLEVEFYLSPAITELAIADYTDLVQCYGVAARSFGIIGWGCETINGSRNLDGGWGELVITDL